MNMEDLYQEEVTEKQLIKKFTKNHLKLINIGMNELPTAELNSNLSLK